jgi:hypothetical protein
MHEAEKKERAKVHQSWLFEKEKQLQIVSLLLLNRFKSLLYLKN